LYYALYEKLSPQSVISNQSSLSEMGHVEQGIRQSFIGFWQRFIMSDKKEERKKKPEFCEAPESGIMREK
jgi:hypothetical protein